MRRVWINIYRVKSGKLIPGYFWEYKKDAKKAIWKSLSYKGTIKVPDGISEDEIIEIFLKSLVQNLSSTVA